MILWDFWWRYRDLNPGHADYDSAALTTWATPPTKHRLGLSAQIVNPNVALLITFYMLAMHLAGTEFQT